MRSVPMWRSLRRIWTFRLPARGRVNTKEREAAQRKCDFEDIECGMTHEEACAESGRCLRCDHFGYGIFKGGRIERW